MSLRPEIFGFDLARLRALLGCGDQALASRAATEVARLVQEPVAEAVEIARRAVLSGVPFVGLDAEGDCHVATAIVLSKMDQTLDDVKSSAWNMSPIWSLASLFPALGGTDHPFRIFLEGRPIFGKRIATGWSYYGFLAHPELKLVRAALVPVRETLVSVPEAPQASLESIVRLKEKLSRAIAGISNDDALEAFLGRLVDEGTMLGNRIGRNLSSAAASRRGWPRTHSPKVRAAMESFSEQFRFARAKARPRDMLPFLDELDGWLARFVAGGHDLLFFTA